MLEYGAVPSSFSGYYSSHEPEPVGYVQRGSSSRLVLPLSVETDVYSYPWWYAEELASAAGQPQALRARMDSLLLQPLERAERALMVPAPAAAAEARAPAAGACPYRLRWAQLLARVFRCDATCPACAGPLRPSRHSPMRSPYARIRTGWEWTVVPPLAPARLASQRPFAFAA
ncbi:MAG: hypothetical protein AB1505_02640 [Candidatus Latescibacterota bacterium]